MEKHAFIKQCIKLLDTPELTEEMAAARAACLPQWEDCLLWAGGQVYRADNGEQAEQNLGIQRQVDAVDGNGIRPGDLQGTHSPAGRASHHSGARTAGGCNHRIGLPCQHHHRRSRNWENTHLMGAAKHLQGKTPERHKYPPAPDRPRCQTDGAAYRHTGDNHP